MALTIRVAATNADLNAINTLITLKVGTPSTSIADELIADGWPVVMAFTLAVWQPIMADAENNRIVMAFAGATLRGAGWWHLDGDYWQMKLVGIDKRLTDQQRLDGFRDAVIEAASRVPTETKFSGIVKIGGKLDTYMNGKLAKRDVVKRENGSSTNFVEYRTTAAEMIAKL